MDTTHPIPSDYRFINLTGEKYGILTVTSLAGKGSGSFMWNCVCECGERRIVAGGKLKSGHTRSCGCLFRMRLGNRNRTHGRSQTSLHNSWKAMKARCTRKTCASYPRYGGRGIMICERWLKFENFLADMGERPDVTYSIERVDNDKGYEPNNCVWAKKKTQARNKRNNRHITAFGETRTLAEWAELTGMIATTITSRINRGWSAEDAMSSPT